MAKTLKKFISSNIKIEDDILFRGFKIQHMFSVALCHQLSTVNRIFLI